MNSPLRYRVVVSVTLGIIAASIGSFFSPGAYLVIGFWIKTAGWSLLFYVIMTVAENKKKTGKLVDVQYLVNHKQKTSLAFALLLMYFTILPSPLGTVDTVEGPVPCIWQFPVGSYCLDPYGNGLQIIPVSAFTFTLYYAIASLAISILGRKYEENDS